LGISFFTMKFKKNIQKSFKRVKTDHEALKQNTSEWIAYLNTYCQELEQKIKTLEKKNGRKRRILA
jgi:hypothetical protein